MLKISAVLGTLGLALLLLSALPRPAPSPGPAGAAAPTSALAGDAAYGKSLFSAKGCVSCHRIAAIPESGAFGGSDVPDLTNYAANPDFLRLWLKDPSAVRPGTQMPTLGLNENEIEVLIAFLSANAAR